MLREKSRSLLVLFAVALGVAVVLAIDLAGDAAAGSFHSSLQTLAGDNNLEVTADGGVPESIVGDLARLPWPIRVTPRIEDHATVAATGETIPLIGIDFVAQANDPDEAQLYAPRKTLPSSTTSTIPTPSGPPAPSATASVALSLCSSTIVSTTYTVARLPSRIRARQRRRCRHGHRRRAAGHRQGRTRRPHPPQSPRPAQLRGVAAEGSAPFCLPACNCCRRAAKPQRIAACSQPFAGISASSATSRSWSALFSSTTPSPSPSSAAVPKSAPSARSAQAAAPFSSHFWPRLPSSESSDRCSRFPLGTPARQRSRAPALHHRERALRLQPARHARAFPGLGPARAHRRHWCRRCLGSRSCARGRARPAHRRHGPRPTRIRPPRRTAPRCAPGSPARHRCGLRCPPPACRRQAALRIRSPRSCSLLLPLSPFPRWSTAPHAASLCGVAETSRRRSAPRRAQPRRLAAPNLRSGGHPLHRHRHDDRRRHHGGQLPPNRRHLDGATASRRPLPASRR